VSNQCQLVAQKSTNKKNNNQHKPKTTINLPLEQSRQSCLLLDTTCKKENKNNNEMGTRKNKKINRM